MVWMMCAWRMPVNARSPVYISTSSTPNAYTSAFCAAATPDQRHSGMFMFCWAGVMNCAPHLAQYLLVQELGGHVGHCTAATVSVLHLSYRVARQCWCGVQGALTCAVTDRFHLGRQRLPAQPKVCDLQNRQICPAD